MGIRRKKQVSKTYIDLTKDMYDGVVTWVRIIGENQVVSYLYQGSALGPYRFALETDEPTRDIEDEVSWCMFFVVDLN